VTKRDSKNEKPTYESTPVHSVGGMLINSEENPANLKEITLNSSRTKSTMNKVTANPTHLNSYKKAFCSLAKN